MMATGEPGGNGQDRPGPTRRQAGLALGVLLAATAAAYCGTLLGGFVWDDREWILPVAGRPPLQVLWEDLRHRQAGEGLSYDYYRPLVNVTFAVDGLVWGGRALGFRLTNLLLYLACVALAFPLAHRLVRTRRAALLAVAAFALHPVHVEAVVWTIARADLMAFAATAAALAAFARALDQGTPGGTRGVAMGGALLLALLSKESALVAPGLAAACWAIPRDGRRAPPRRAIGALAPILLALLVYAVLRLGAGEGAAPPAPDRVAPQDRWLLGPVLFLKYVGLLLWPYPLTAYYDFPPPGGVADPRVLLGAVLLLAALAATGWAARRAPRMALALTWFLMSLVPVLQFVPLKGFIMAERYLFLPSFGFALAVGLAGEAVWQRARTVPARVAGCAGAAALAALWVAIIANRVPDWADQLTFYRAMVRTAPDSAFARNNLGQLLVAAGEVDEGLVHLRRAVDLRPDMAFAHAGMGVAYLKQGDPTRSAAALERAARLRPDDPRILGDLAAALWAAGRPQHALDALHRLERLRPGSAEVARRLAAAYAAAGDGPRAEAYRARAARLAAASPPPGGSWP